MSFSSLGLSAALLKAVAEKKYEQAYPIQRQAIPAILKGRDVFGMAPTGSGKTDSFALPILELLQNRKLSANRYPQVLVLVPTRELAIQVGDVFQYYIDAIPKKIKILAVYGGVSINPQMMALQNTQIVVATPGRLLDLVRSNSIHLSETEVLVLDEADKMMNLGFKDEMDEIFRLLPAKRQNILFSATLGEQVDFIKKNMLRDPLLIEVKKEKTDVDLISQVAYLTDAERKGVLLRYLIKNENMQQVLVFVSSVHQADHVVVKLNKNGIDASAMHSKKSQGARIESLNKFKNGKLRVLVATDIASRGIDIQFLPFVINYELPRSPLDYVHRIGRTGRAESPGKAITLICPDDSHHFKIIQKKMGKTVSMIDTADLNLQGF
ncbi:MAG TPA: DEAD/DEAH box helicase [Cytophagaceae bacterium]|jgi:ATP-dependent RNA helicase RhlE|nr:DEAD/DEAH box helicase [Cytophagaceae bacterium]